MIISTGLIINCIDSLINQNKEFRTLSFSCEKNSYFNLNISI